MKKRVKGLLALCLVCCIATFTGASTVSAASSRYLVDHSGIVGEAYAELDANAVLFPGDTLDAGFTGGFVVFNKNTDAVLPTGDEENPGVAAYYETESGDFAQNENYRYFSQRDGVPQSYVLPTLAGYYGYRYDSIVNTTDADSPANRYGTYTVTQPGYTIYDSPVLFLYLTPLPNTYTVRFEANHTNAVGTMADQTFTYDASQKLSANAYSLTGYTFDGWMLDENTKYLDEMLVGNLTAENNAVVTLTARWKPIVYTVKFHANGGSGEMAEQRFDYDISQSLAANVFTSAGQTFVGWNTVADGTGTRYSDREILKNLSATDGAVIDLYAQWKDAPTTTVSTTTQTTTAATTTQSSEIQTTTTTVAVTTGSSTTQTTTTVTTTQSSAVQTTKPSEEPAPDPVVPDTGRAFGAWPLLFIVLSAGLMALAIRKKPCHK